jgi:hypothetical protein
LSRRLPGQRDSNPLTAGRTTAAYNGCDRPLNLIIKMVHTMLG